MQVVGTSYFDTWANYQVGYDLLSQSRENNTSTVRFYGVLNVTGNQISWTWANASVWGTTWGLSGQYYRGSHTVVQQDVVITHNNDGTYSGTLSGTLSASWTGGTASGTFTLPKIARYPYLTSGTNFFDNTNPVYTISNPDTTHSVKVKLEAGGNTQLITRMLPAGYSGTYTLELTDAERTTLLALTPNSTTLPVVETVCAMNGDTELSWSYKNYTMTVDGYVIPFTATYEDTNSTTLTITNDDQQIIRNNSTLQIDVTGATAMKEATLSTLEAEINGEIYTGTLSGTTGTINVGTLNISSDTRAKVYIYDSRGYGSMNPLNLEILNWEIPTGIVNLSRQNNYYTDTDINVDANYSSLDNKNVLTLKVRSKKVGESSYGAYTTLQDNVTTTLQLDNNYQWDVQVLVEDLIGSTTYNLTIDRGIPLIFFDREKRSVGINKFPQHNSSLEVDGDLYNNSLDLFNDTSGSTLKEMLINKLNYCINNMETNKSNFQAFVNGGWAGQMFGFGLFSKIGTFYQLTWTAAQGTYLIYKNGSTYTFRGVGFESKTDESIVGTWKDDKPIYRKVFTTTGDNNNTQTIFTQNDIDTIVSFSGWVKNGSVIRGLNTCFYGGLSWASQFYFNNGYGNIECGNDMKTFKNGASIYATVEYTKTTD